MWWNSLTCLNLFKINNIIWLFLPIFTAAKDEKYFKLMLLKILCLYGHRTNIDLIHKEAFQSCLSGTTVSSSYWRSIPVFTRYSQNIPIKRKGLYEDFWTFWKPLAPLCYANWRNISWKCRFMKIYKSHSIVLVIAFQHSWSYSLYLIDILQRRPFYKNKSKFVFWMLAPFISFISFLPNKAKIVYFCLM